jgi:hypothetical protein
VAGRAYGLLVLTAAGNLLLAEGMTGFTIEKVAAHANAIARGQLRADIDPETIVDQLWGACYHRLLLPDQPLTEDFAHALVDNLIRGLQ